MILVITEDAKADLMEIKNFIHPHNPKRAESFIDELLDKCAISLRYAPRISFNPPL